MGTDAAAPPADADAGPSRPGWLPVVALAALAAVGVWTVADLRPPAAAGPQTLATEFSAARAFGHIEALAGEPRAMGTAAHAAAREYLTGELQALGARVHIHEEVGIAPRPQETRSTGLVHNIVAVFPGADPTGQVVLAAHYDSVPTSPGANDDAAGVAVTLEAARALTTRPGELRNDLVVLLTDGEEPGLLGAEAFVHSHPRGARGGVVLNHEARGAAGAAMMFRTTSGDLVRTLGRVGPAPVADSAMADAFALLPNDTDFVAFTQGGFLALDFAYAGASAYYHSALDTPEHVSARSVQHLGTNTLALAAELTGADLREVSGGVGVAYANIPPGLLLIIPHGALQVLGLIGVVLAAAAVWRSRRRGLTSLPRVGGGVVAAAVLIVAAVGAAWVYWLVLSWFRPGFTDLLTQTPYRPVAFQVGMLTVVLAVALAWWRLARKVTGGPGLALGAVVATTVLGAGAAAVAPGSAVAFVLPGFAAALAAATMPRSGAGRVLLTAACLVPTAMLVLPAAWVSFEVGLSLSPLVVAPFAALAFALALPLLEALSPPRARRRPIAWLTTAVLLLTVGGATGIGMVRNPLDGTQPVPVYLGYTLDAATGEATWAVPMRPDRPRADPAHPWLATLVDRVGPDPTPGSAADQAHLGEAPAMDLPPPQVHLTDERRSGGHRVLELAVSSPRGAPTVHLGVADPGRFREVRVNGRQVPEMASAVEFHGLPPGDVLLVELHLSGTDPVRLAVADISETLDAVAQLPGHTGAPPEVFLGGVRVAVTSTHEY